MSSLAHIDPSDVIEPLKQPQNTLIDVTRIFAVYDSRGGNAQVSEYGDGVSDLVDIRPIGHVT